MSSASSFDDTGRLGGAARLLARLTPKSMPLMPGQGGIPSLTPQDIAAALGLAARGSVRDRIAVDVLCLRHWPEAFDGPQVRNVATESVLAADVASMPKNKPERVSRTQKQDTPAQAAAKRVEACRRGVHALEHARKRQLVAFVAARARRQAQQRIAECAEADVAFGERIAQAAFWEALARAVLAEYAQPNPCQVCKGRGQQLRLIGDPRVPGKVRAEMAVCEACIGYGTTGWSYKRRAKEVHVRAEFYRLWVNTIHERELALLREMEREALRRFSVRLGR
jgi:hypothetical protein